MNEYFMGIDIGTSSIRAVLFDTEGSQKSICSIETSIISTLEGWSEIEPDSILSSVIKAVQGCMEKSGINKNHLAGIGMSCQMHSIMAVDSHGDPLTKVIIWADNRARKESEFINDNFIVSDLYNKTGCRVQHPMYPLSKLLWLKNNNKDVFHKAHKFLTAKEYIILKLYGEFVVDYTLAASQGFFNIHTQKWDKDILSDILGLKEDKLSEVVECTYRLRGLKTEYAAVLGIDPETPVIIGTGDGIAANIGCGVYDNTVLSSTIGTSGAIRTAVAKPLLDPNQQTWCYSFTKEMWVAGGAINNGGIVLKWLKEEFRGLFESEATVYSESIYKLFDRYAGEIKPGSDGLIFLPYLTGERSPDWNSEARGLMYGLGLSHGRKHIIRAAMEGIMYRIFSVYEVLSKLQNSAEQIRATGGYTKSPLWLQMQADIFNKDILVSGVSETSALGVAYLCMFSLGIVKNIKDLLPGMAPKTVIKPIKANHDVYEGTYKLSKQIYNNIYHKSEGDQL